jgi:hypothetical protein
MFGLAVGLFVLAGVLLVVGVSTLIMAPLLAGRVAATTSRPKLERRASGPDRMRTLIHSQISERRQRSGLSVTLTRTGVALAVAAVVSLVGGVIALIAGY